MSATAKPKTVTFKRFAYSDAKVEVTLVPKGEALWDVLHKGVKVGAISSYEGSIDRSAGRLRTPGKSRTLWGIEGSYVDGRYIPGRYGLTSRAEALRRLVP